MSFDPLLDSEGIGSPINAEFVSVIKRGNHFRYECHRRPNVNSQTSTEGKAVNPGQVRRPTCQCSGLADQAAIPERHGGNDVELSLVGDTPGNDAFKVGREVLPEIVLTIDGNAG